MNPGTPQSVRHSSRTRNPTPKKAELDETPTTSSRYLRWTGEDNETLLQWIIGNLKFWNEDRTKKSKFDKIAKEICFSKSYTTKHVMNHYDVLVGRYKKECLNRFEKTGAGLSLQEQEEFETIEGCIIFSVLC